MLATADCSNHYTGQRKYQNEWIDNHTIKIPWLNYLTAQSIPEESDSDCSSSSGDDCYVVLEIQRPRQIDHSTDTIEEEEEELYFAQINEDNHHVEYEQFARPMLIETPPKKYVVKHQTVQRIIVDEHVTVTQLSNNILFHKPKISDKSIKQIQTKLSTSSNDEYSNLTTFKTIQHINRYQPTSISFVPAKQQSMKTQCSIASLDSIENKSSTTSPIQARIKTNMSHISSQRISNLHQAQRQNSALEIETSARAFIIDRACKEKYARVQDQKMTHVETTRAETKAPLLSLYVTSIEEPRSSFYLNNKSNITGNSATLNNHSKVSSLIRSMKKYTRPEMSEYELSNNPVTEISSDEPTLLQMKYLDEQQMFASVHIPEPPRKPRTLSSSISCRLSLQRMLSTQDLSTNGSYRKRVLNRFQTFLKTNPTEQDISSSRPWQQKTITELFNERNFKDKKSIY